MAEVLEYAARLSQAIGARPSGTEEEQQASFFIEETFQQAGLDTQIEEFNCNPNYELPRVIFCIAAIVLAILAIFFQILVIPVFIVTLVLAALFALEVLGMSPFNKTAKRGISQNVIARYIPGADATASGEDSFLLDGGADPSALLSGLDSGPGAQRSRSGRGGRAAARKRKIVLIARYDSGKVCRELKPSFMKALEYLPWVEIGGFALIPLAFLVRMIFDAQGPLLVVLNTIVVIAAIAILIPVIIFLLHRTAPWSDGANNNASGTAVMLEVAQRIAKSAKALPEATDAHRVSGADDLVVMHGEDAIEQSGMLPVGTDLIYDEAAQGELSQEQLAAKAAAIAATESEAMSATGGAAPSAAAPAVTDDAGHALTMPVGEEAARQEAVMTREASPAAAQGARAAAGAAGAASTPRQGVPAASAPSPAASFAPQSESKSSVPDWFKKGIAAANANKEAQENDKNTPIVRSRFSDALDAAHETSAGSIEEFASREQASADAAASVRDEQGEFVSPWAAPGASASAARRSAAPERAAVGTNSVAAASASAPSPVANANPAAAAAASQARPAAESVGSQATGEISLAAAAAIEEAQAQEAAQLAQSVEEVAEQAAAADRTISFIPVAAEIPAEISAAEVVESVDATQADLLAKTPEEILAEASSAASVSGNPRAAARESTKDAKRQKRTISLPSLTGAIEAVSTKMQAAPLADDAERTPGDARAVVTKRAPRPALPVLTADDAADEIEAEPVAFASSSFEPVGDGLIANMEQDDIVIEDVDDSDYETNTTPTGAIAGPGYVEMPKSRVSRLRGIFGRKKKEADEATSFVEAVGLDEDFDARKVGADRGGWESFQNESADWDGRSDANPSASASEASAASAGKRKASSTAGAAATSRSSAGKKASRAAQPAGRAPGQTQSAAKRSSTSAASAQGRATTASAAAGTQAAGARSSRRAASAGAAATADAAGAAAAKPSAANAKAKAKTKAASTSAAASASSASAAKPTASRTTRSGRGAHSRQLDEMRAEEETRSRKTKSAWDDWDEYDDWNGGGFSLSRIGDAVKSVGKGKQDGADAGADDGVGDVAEGSRSTRSGRASGGRQRRKNPGELLASMAQDAADEVNASEAAFAATSGSTGRASRNRDGGIDPETMIDEREQIRSFRSGASALTSFEDIAAFAGTLSASNADETASTPDEAEGDMHDLAQPQGFQTEVWFVALGAELADNSGIKAFLAEHGSELRGAIVIDIEAMGAGTLSLIESEGTIRRTKASSRMKRYVSKAGSALGMRIGNEKMNWRESAAYCASRKGLQTIHVAGMQDGKPAYMGDIDDTISNVDEDKLLENAAFVLELLHNI